MRTIDLDAARQKVRAAIAESRAKLAIAEAASAAAAKFDGKPVSKRIASAIESALPGFRVHYSTEHGFYNVTVWGGPDSAVSYSSRVIFNLGYSNAGTSRKPAGDPPTYRHADRLGRDLGGYAGSAETIRQGEALLAELPARVAAYIVAREAYDAARAPLSRFGVVD